MNKLIGLIIVILIFSPKLIAQLVSTDEANNHVITGDVQDRFSKQPIEFATIQLLKAADSAVRPPRRSAPDWWPGAAE